MKTTAIEASLRDLNQRVQSGQLIEAFEKYYHDQVSMQENDNPATVSKKANLAREKEFLSNITEFRAADVVSMAIGENLSTVIWHYDYTHKEWGVKNYTQVSVQTWQDGLIIREQFIY